MPCTYIPGSVPPVAEFVLGAVVVLAALCACLRSGDGCSGGEAREEFVREGDDVEREAASTLASCSFQATALRRRISEASLTRRLKRGSVARVRKVSLRILE